MDILLIYQKYHFVFLNIQQYNRNTKTSKEKLTEFSVKPDFKRSGPKPHREI